MASELRLTPEADVDILANLPPAGKYWAFLSSARSNNAYKVDSAGAITPLGIGFVDPMTTRGDLIYRNAANATARLAIGGAGTFLSSNGTDASWGTPPAASLAAVLAVGNDGNALDIVNLAGLQDSSADRSIDIENRQLVTLTGAVWSLDWQNRLQADSAGQNAIDWQNRTLIDNTLTTKFNWQAFTFPTLAGGGTQMLTVNNAGVILAAAIPAGTVTSVSGTANRITSTGGATPVLDISGSYVGQSSITTLGTIATGVWQGTTVAKTYGGTGVNIATAALTLGTASANTGVLTLQNATNANTVTVQSGVTSATYTLTLPTAQGAASDTLVNDGAGNLSWGAAASNSAGSKIFLWANFI